MLCSADTRRVTTVQSLTLCKLVKEADKIGEDCHPQLQHADAGTGVPEACFAAMPNSVISSEVRGLFSLVLVPLV